MMEGTGTNLVDVNVSQQRDSDSGATGKHAQQGSGEELPSELDDDAARSEMTRSTGIPDGLVDYYA